MFVIQPADLRRAREAADLTIERVARALDVSERTIRRMEQNGHVKPRHAEALERLYGVALVSKRPVSSSAAKESTPIQAADEMELLKLQVRDLVARYNMRLSQRAPKQELDRLLRSLSAVVRNIIEAGTVDADHMDHAVGTFVGSLVQRAPAAPATEDAERHIRES